MSCIYIYLACAGAAIVVYIKRPIDIYPGISSLNFKKNVLATGKATWKMGFLSLFFLMEISIFIKTDF